MEHSYFHGSKYKSMFNFMYLSSFISECLVIIKKQVEIIASTMVKVFLTVNRDQK